MAERLRLSTKKGFKLPRGAVSVAHGTRWATPFGIGSKVLFGPGKVETSKQAVDEYSRLLDAEPWRKVHVRKELRGKNLYCTCRPGEPCHADLLLQIANS